MLIYIVFFFDQKDYKAWVIAISNPKPLIEHELTHFIFNYIISIIWSLSHFVLPLICPKAEIFRLNQPLDLSDLSQTSRYHVNEDRAGPAKIGAPFKILFYNQINI